MLYTLRRATPAIPMERVTRCQRRWLGFFCHESCVAVFGRHNILTAVLHVVSAAQLWPASAAASVYLSETGRRSIVQRTSAVSQCLVVCFSQGKPPVPRYPQGSKGAKTVPVVPAPGHNWSPDTGVACVPRNAAADVYAGRDGARAGWTTGGIIGPYHNEPML